MGPITFALCHKALIGPAMWITGLCSFPPLIDALPFPLDAGGSTVSSAFSVPVDKNYEFFMSFEFVSTEARLQDKLVGSNYGAACDRGPAPPLAKSEYGRPIPIRIVIRKMSDKSIVIDSEFVTLCVQGWMDNHKGRSIAWLALSQGEYTAEVTNVTAQEGFGAVTSSISLVAGGAK